MLQRNVEGATMVGRGCLEKEIYILVVLAVLCAPLTTLDAP
jgi:hypothetical protein